MFTANKGLTMQIKSHINKIDKTICVSFSYCRTTGVYKYKTDKELKEIEHKLIYAIKHDVRKQIGD